MTRTKMKIKKGDQVVVLTGRSRGLKGEVLRAIPEKQRVVVHNVNMVTHHNRATQTSPGGFDRKEAPIHVSNVALVDPKSGEATRVGYRTLKDGKKVRVAKKSGETVE
jgi:large subunit ribosomal protein L24